MKYLDSLGCSTPDQSLAVYYSYTVKPNGVTDNLLLEGGETHG